ncbi:MAG: 16S rRNA (uracil(1498)-N(3))-methyltransferase [Gammaproteobacteria bacterium]|nr:16S rRNA (uracil(1498)-N(3))-methyltransferase [Gammaproteobacteria bacterium]
MNLLLLFSQDFITSNRVRLTDHRLQHLLSVKKVEINDILEVGLLNDMVGQAQVISIDKYQVELEVSLSKEPVTPLDVNLILALPRPKMFKRILQTISAMGVKQLNLIHSAKVEKSYWQSPWLEAEKMQQHLFLGLEQSKDTIMPEVKCFKRFKPFIEDIAPSLISDSKAIVAHPGRGSLCFNESLKNCKQTITLAIGPEGGFIDYEIDLFERAGFQSCHLGDRILRVENAIPVLLGRLI